MKKTLNLYLDFSEAKKQKSRKILLFLTTLVLSGGLIVILTALNSFFIDLVPDNESWALAFLAFPFSILSIFLNLFLHNQNKNSTYILGKRFNNTYEWHFAYGIKGVFEASIFTPTLYIIVGLVTSNFSHLVGGSLMLTILLGILSLYEYKRAKVSLAGIYHLGFKDIYFDLSCTMYSNEEIDHLIESVVKEDLNAERKIVTRKNFKIFYAIENLFIEIKSYTDEQIKDILSKFTMMSSSQRIDFTNLGNLCFYDMLVEKVINIDAELRQNSKNACADEMVVGLILSWIQISLSFRNLIEKNMTYLIKILSKPICKKHAKILTKWIKNSKKLLLNFLVYDRTSSKILDLSSQIKTNELYSTVLDKIEENVKETMELYEEVNKLNIKIIETVQNDSKKEVAYDQL